MNGENSQVQFSMRSDDSNFLIVNSYQEGQRKRSQIFLHSLSSHFKEKVEEDQKSEKIISDEERESDRQEKQMEIQEKKITVTLERSASTLSPNVRSKIKDNENRKSMEFLSQDLKKLDEIKEKFSKSQHKMASTKKEDQYLESRIYKQKQPYYNIFNRQIWKKSVFTIIYFIKQFLSNLRRKTFFINPKKLTKQQLLLINDKSAQFPEFQSANGEKEFEDEEVEQNSENQKDYNNVNKKSQILRKILKRLRILRGSLAKSRFYNSVKKSLAQLNQKFPIFHSHNFFHLIWEIISFITKIILIIEIPFKASFSYDFGKNEVNLNIIFSTIFLIDSFIKANTSFYQSGILVHQRLKIFKHFLRKNLVSNLIIAIILLNKFDDDSFLVNLFLYIIVLFETIRHSDGIDFIRNKMEMNKKFSSLHDLLDLLVKILYFNHIFACIIHYVGQYQTKNGDQENWLEINKLANNSVSSRYIASYYFGTITMCTVGYGDFHPESDLERIVLIIMAFLSCGIFGYSINCIGSIIIELGQRNQQFKQEITLLNNFMKFHNVDSALQNQARNYYMYVHREEHEHGKNSNKDCLKILSKGMQEQILKNIFYEQIEKIPFLRKNFSKSLLQTLALKAKQRTLGSGEKLIINNEQTTPAIYLIDKGKLDVSLIKRNSEGKNSIIESDSKSFKLLSKGDFYGQLEFFSNSQLAYYSLTSLGITNILYFTLTDFFEALQENNNKSDQETFYMIKDCVVYGQEYDLIDLPCFSCLTYHHLTINCPFLTYGGNQDQMIRHINREESEFRKSFIRKRAKGEGFRNRKYQIQYDGIEWYRENQIYSEKYQDVYILDEALYQKTDSNYKFFEEEDIENLKIGNNIFLLPTDKNTSDDEEDNVITLSRFIERKFQQRQNTIQSQYKESSSSQYYESDESQQLNNNMNMGEESKIFEQFGKINVDIKNEKDESKVLKMMQTNDDKKYFQQDEEERKFKFPSCLSQEDNSSNKITYQMIQLLAELIVQLQRDVQNLAQLKNKNQFKIISDNLDKILKQQKSIQIQDKNTITNNDMQINNLSIDKNNEIWNNSIDKYQAFDTYFPQFNLDQPKAESGRDFHMSEFIQKLKFSIQYKQSFV